ncbi:hypothetical protein CEP54_007559 [Fusarium duplospermum]|uniref:AAA+ ATPase domain-containing protein n=1 Tax=Fusarium duplospermum TaxID=1325734 RepID=A0A428Q0U8_9HYPO|nr:hypothetical protein CEP54_007559 [Fusarium duplospermum]
MPPSPLEPKIIGDTQDESDLPDLSVPDDLAPGRTTSIMSIHAVLQEPLLVEEPVCDSQHGVPPADTEAAGAHDQAVLDVSDHAPSTYLPQSSTAKGSTPPLPPQLILPPDDSPAISRSETPYSDVTSATTAVSENSDWSPSHSAKPVQGSPPLSPQSSKSSDHDHDDDPSELALGIPALQLPNSSTDQFPRHREGPIQNGRVQSTPGSPTLRPILPHSDTSRSCPVSPQLQPSAVPSSSILSLPNNPFKRKRSKAAQEWARRKRWDGEESDVLDELMGYQGLEEVKQRFLDIKSKADVCKKQDPDGELNRLKSERFNIVFQGNPGTGKTTIARLYARFLYELDILDSEDFEETSGIKVATEGPQAIRQQIEEMIDGRGGVLFVDEAYQLTAPYVSGFGRQALDVILTMMENHIGELAVIFVGYKDEMEPFFEHNPGLASRIPYTMNFADFDDAELWSILADNINKQYRGRMRIEGGIDGLYMRIAIRRLAQARGSHGFGNARAVENLLARITERQAQRLSKEKQQFVPNPDYFLFTQEDLIGPDPSVMASQCTAWTELQKLVGLDQVKGCVKRLVGMIKLNYQRELREDSPLKFSLNQLFVGAPGTGKTTVAKLYGRILSDLGYLSKGDVVLKNPADFIGECLGKSEAKTKKILEASVGKILVIDEAYMLDAGDPSKDQDKFKTGVIDTIVSMIQGVPGEDRCIILVGYEDKIRDMFHHVNPGLSRRFPIERPFRFENFTLDQLEQILRFKMHEQDLVASDAAIRTARDMFERALMRPNFTNAGEVDSALATAKMNYETRQSQIPLDQQTFDSRLDAVDFDPEFDRGERPDLDCHGMLEGLVHHSIIDRLAGYQKRCLKSRLLGLNPRDQVPSNFIFKGFPGTGKTTTAKNMGKIFYNMGFLSTSEVIECSATDLLGQYVGQTAPKTLKKLQEGMGRVLFIDEAYRLMYGSYGADAVDELVGFLSKPANVGKMIVILAGFTADMHRLISLYPVLSGLFPEEIAFDHIPPDDCILLLRRELAASSFHSDNDFLDDKSSEDYGKVKRLFRILAIIPSWSNARDVKNLAKQILGRFLETSPSDGSPERILTAGIIIECMKHMITQRKDRLATMDSDGNGCLPQQPSLGITNPRPGLENPQLAPPPTPSKTSICTPGVKNSCAIGSDVAIEASHETTDGHHNRQASLPPATAQTQKEPGADLNGEYQHDSPDGAEFREDGVSDAVWRELRIAQDRESIKYRELKADEQRLQRNLRSAEAVMKSCSDQDVDFSEKMAACDALRNELMGVQTRLQHKQKIQQTLQQMNRCEYGYCWTKVDGGYRCEGGMHFVPDAEVQARMM